MHIYLGQMYPPPPMDKRSMEHHYTKSFDHDDIKFYPPQTCMQMHFLVTGNITFFIIIIIIITCGTRPSRALLHQDSITYWRMQTSWDTQARLSPPQLNLVLQSSTTPGQFDMWQNADLPRLGVPPIPWSSSLVVQNSTTPDCRYTRMQIYPCQMSPL